MDVAVGNGWFCWGTKWLNLNLRVSHVLTDVMSMSVNVLCTVLWAAQPDKIDVAGYTKITNVQVLVDAMFPMNCSLA
jgi:hypothetical protein